MEELLSLIAKRESIFPSWWILLAAHCLLSKFALAKLTAKGEPQCENYLRAERWRSLSKISPV